MKIIKFTEFIKEEFQDTPESYIEMALKVLKRKIDKMFEFQEDENQEEEREQDIKSVNRKEKNKMSFQDLGVRLESSEVSKYSKTNDSLTVKFSDDSHTYTLIIMIDLKEAIPKDPQKDFDIDQIEKCYIKFKKYDLDTFEVIGQITKNAEIKKIDEDFIINLKLELDEKFEIIPEEGDEENFKIETE
jgi:hypothetical protein